MKKYLFINTLLLLLLFPAKLLAQEVSDSLLFEKEISAADQERIQINIHRGSVKLAKEFISGIYCDVEARSDDFTTYWTKFFRDDYHIRLKNKKEVYQARLIHIPEITHQEINVYCRMYDYGTRVRVEFGITDVAGSSFDSSYDDTKYRAMKSFLHRSVSKYYTQYYNRLLQKLQDQKGDLMQRKERLVNDRKRVKNDLVQLNRTISLAQKNRLRAETNIEKSLTNMEQKKDEIKYKESYLNEHQESLNQLDDQIAELGTDKPEDMELLVNKKKDISGKLMKLKNEIARANKVIVRNEQNITKNKNKAQQSQETITLSEAEIDKKNQDIEALSTDVEIVDSKLSVKQGQINKINLKLAEIPVSPL